MMRHRLPWFFANLALMAAPLSAGASGTPNLWTRSSGNLTEVPVPPRLNVEATGTALNVSWTADRPGWWMEQQTNAPGVGLGTNWHPVPGTHGSNHLTIPINPALGSAFTRLAYQPSMQPLRREAASRRRRIIFNNDGNEPVYQMTQPTVERLLAARTAGLLGSHVDSIFYCPWSSGFSLFTYFTTAGQVMTTREGRYGTNQMPALVEAGIDPLRVMVDYAKQHDLEIFCSFRMNDTHDGSTADYGPPLLRTNTLKQTHPEYLIGTASSKPKHGEWTAVDYGRPEIRELAFRFAEEVCTNYNVDGIEFDFFRHPVFFRSTAAGAVATDADRAAMTALFQRIRQMADNVGRSRARPLLIAMRVPDSVAYCRAMGLDLENWLASDLLDLLVVSGYFQLNDWNYSVALARQYGVKIYPSLDPPNIPNATARALRATELAWRGRAANVWGYGADGVYMFNSFDPASPLWRTLGDPQGLAALDKDFFGSVRGVMVAAGGNLPYASYQTAETLNPSNPKTVAPGASATARINVGDDLSQAGPATLKLRLQFTPAVDPQKLQVTCNAIPLTFLSAQGTWLEYLVSPGDIHRPSNQIKVTLTSDAPQAAWSDLMLELRH